MGDGPAPYAAGIAAPLETFIKIIEKEAEIVNI